MSARLHTDVSSSWEDLTQTCNLFSITEGYTIPSFHKLAKQHYMWLETANGNVLFRFNNKEGPHKGVGEAFCCCSLFLMTWNNPKQVKSRFKCANNPTPHFAHGTEMIHFVLSSAELFFNSTYIASFNNTLSALYKHPEHDLQAKETIASGKNPLEAGPWAGLGS